MAEWIMVVLTLVVVFLTLLVVKVYDRIAWLTGSMESHSDLMLRIEARRGINGEPVKLLWWDPTIEGVPTKKQHGQEVDLSTHSRPSLSGRDGMARAAAVRKSRTRHTSKNPSSAT